MYYIYRDFVGLNEIEPLLRDYFIEDIECNGVNTPIYIVHRKYKNLKTNIIYNDIKVLTDFVEKLAQKSGQYISYANPLLDAALPDGSRVNATYTQDISSRGPTFTIRKFTKEPWSPIKLMEFRTVSPELLAYIWLLIEHECNIMVIGGTGSGKTTLLNTLAFFIPPSSRVVSIEDTRELNILHENWLPSVTRSGIGMG
ncbi:MAG: type II/IV secretion system ATPase subunit, partial [Candidatus Woesearchaeota archaeon]|nr:type II/IV secretion system ATPase subunit [Candidatus Woesearchaeota archaeon]